jgi:hypothetical protein
MGYKGGGVGGENERHVFFKGLHFDTMENTCNYLLGLVCCLTGTALTFNELGVQFIFL